MQSAKSSHKKQIFTTYLCRPAFFYADTEAHFFVQLGKIFSQLERNIFLTGKNMAHKYYLYLV